MSVEVPSHGTQSLQQLRKIICNLAMPRIDREEIQVRKKPWNKETVYQGCTVWAVKPTYASGTNERDDVGYGCVITFSAYDSQDVNSNIDQIPFWIASVRQRLSFLGRLEITLRKGCSYGTMTIGDYNAKPPANHPEANKYEMDSLLIRSWIRESRG